MAVNSRTALVTVIHAQNEIGTIQPVAAISAQVRKHKPLIHADAAQSVGKVPIDVNEFGVDLLSIAGHKLYASKGIGALYIRRGVILPPLLLGAEQEYDRRPGTENVPYIVGLGEVCRLVSEALKQGAERQMRSLWQILLDKLRTAVPGLIVVGDGAKRLPNTLNVLFPSVSGREILATCPGVVASISSACHADREDPSAILLALGFSSEAALGTVRFSLGCDTTVDDICAAVPQLVGAWESLRSKGSSTFRVFK